MANTPAGLSNSLSTPTRAKEISERLRGRPDRLLDVGHAKLAHWSFGRGPDVVCVHGWPLHSATFRHLVPYLEEHFTLHLIDLPGTGQSEWSADSRIDFVSHAESVKEAVRLLGLTRFAYLGHDSGAAITRLAAADDARVFGMVMGNTEIPGHVPWQITAFVLAAKVSFIWKLFFQSMKFGPVRRGSLGFGGCFTDSTYVDGEFAEWFLTPFFTTPRVLEGQTRLVQKLDPDVVHGLAETHTRILAKSLLVWGQKDPFFPVEGARAMLPQFRGGAELVVVPNGKLFVHEDRAEEFAAHALPFLLRCAAG